MQSGPPPVTRLGYEGGGREARGQRQNWRQACSLARDGNTSRWRCVRFRTKHSNRTPPASHPPHCARAPAHRLARRHQLALCLQVVPQPQDDPSHWPLRVSHQEVCRRGAGSGGVAAKRRCGSWLGAGAAAAAHATSKGQPIRPPSSMNECTQATWAGAVPEAERRSPASWTADERRPPPTSSQRQPPCPLAASRPPRTALAISCTSSTAARAGYGRLALQARLRPCSWRQPGYECKTASVCMQKPH